MVRKLGQGHHFFTVFLASLVLLQISPSESWSRNFMRRTLPIMSMVITFYILAEVFSRAVEHPCQFSVGGNTQSPGACLHRQLLDPLKGRKNHDNVNPRISSLDRSLAEVHPLKSFTIFKWPYNAVYKIVGIFNY